MSIKFNSFNILFTCFLFFSSPYVNNCVKMTENTFLNLRIDTLNTTNGLIENNNYYAEGPCTSSNCKEPYGVCSSSTQCKCNTGWAQSPFRNVTLQESSCDYSMKSQIWFFLVELVTLVGGGHFYAARYLYGIAKFSGCLLLLFLDFIVGRCYMYNRNKAPNWYNYFIYSFYFAIFLFHTYDLVLIGTNNYLDGNGFPIIHY